METRFGVLQGLGYFRDGFHLYVNRNEESFQMEYHAHDFHEIACVSEGRGYHHIGGRVVSVTKGDIFLLPIGLPHVFRPASAHDGQKLVVLNCVFSDAMLQEASQHVPDLRLAGLFVPEGGQVRDTRLHAEPLLERMVEEYARHSPGSKGMMFALFLQLLVQISRLVHPPESPPGHAPAAADPIEESIDYIRRHPSENLSIRMLADRCGISERHFFRLFKQRTGQSFLEYLRHQRVRLGCELLLATRHKIGAVAEMSGYKDTQTFYEIFKRIVGRTPGEFRKTSAGDGAAYQSREME